MHFFASQLFGNVDNVSRSRQIWLQPGMSDMFKVGSNCV